MKLWHMDTDSYTVKELSEERLEKLNRIDHADLLEVADAMRKKGKAGYQEALVGRMIENI